MDKTSLFNFVKNLISPNARTAAIVVSTYDRPDDESYRKRLITSCREVLNKYSGIVDF